MDTNYYWKTPEVDPLLAVASGGSVTDHDNPAIHIGKRSAAGLFCWDDSLTLCIGGKDMLHREGVRFFEACPLCGRHPSTTARDEVATDVEDGITREHGDRTSGVSNCSSFAWAQPPYLVLSLCDRAQPGDTLIEDQYGQEYTGAEFRAMVETNCPIQFTDSIGRWFS